MVREAPSFTRDSSDDARYRRSRETANRARCRRAGRPRVNNASEVTARFRVLHEYNRTNIARAPFIANSTAEYRLKIPSFSRSADFTADERAVFCPYVGPNARTSAFGTINLQEPTNCSIYPRVFHRRLFHQFNSRLVNGGATGNSCYACSQAPLQKKGRKKKHGRTEVCAKKGVERSRFIAS